MLERGLLARLYSPLILVTRQDFKNLGWSRYITGTNIRIISLSLNLLPIEKKNKEERKNGKSIPMMTRYIFVSISQKGSWFLLLLSTIHSKRSFDRSSSISLSSWIFRMFKTIVRHVVVRWKLETEYLFVSTPRSIPTLFHARKEIIAQFKNRRGCARFLYHAPCPPWQGWKITRPLSSPVTRNENPSLHQETAFHSLKTQRTHTRTPGLIHILFMGRATGTGFSSDFSRVVLSPSPRFASPLFPNIAAAGCNVPRQ